MELDIYKVGKDAPFLTLTNVSPTSKISDIKQLIYKQKSSFYPERISLRLDPKSKTLSDDEKLNSLELKDKRIIYFKDLGPQIGWKTVFILEYLGPLIAYLIIYFRPQFIYGSDASKPIHKYVHIAAACWSLHYLKRLFETLFVHRFSHATMPLKNLFVNCTYYWGFAAYISYYINHPLYTPAYFGDTQVYVSLIGFLLSEFGNYSIHIALRDLRPPGTRERKIPIPTKNPFTFLFRYVSCPNYSYEFYSWIFFTILTQCLPAGLFTMAGLYQMSVWALGKHRNYKKEFPKYPRGRKAIIPYLI